MYLFMLYIAQYIIELYKKSLKLEAYSALTLRFTRAEVCIYVKSETSEQIKLKRLRQEKKK